MTARDCTPGVRAPSAGTYEERNVLGTPTGIRVSVTEGEVLPAAPRGFTWRMVVASGKPAGRTARRDPVAVSVLPACRGRIVRGTRFDPVGYTVRELFLLPEGRFCLQPVDQEGCGI